jgi:hypothetical protein
MAFLPFFIPPDVETCYGETGTNQAYEEGNYFSRKAEDATCMYVVIHTH